LNTRDLREGRAPEDRSAPTAIDLFCGAGGLSLGLERAGFDVRLGVDIDPHALTTYTHNLKTRALCLDIRQTDGSELMRIAGTTKLDLLAGGPSCQGFSTHGKRIAADERNGLYRDFLRLTAEIAPTCVLMENVKGLLLARNGHFKRKVIREFENLGYELTLITLLAADYGVPQLRERVFFLASKRGAIEPPAPTHFDGGANVLPGISGQPYVTLRDAIGDLPQPSATNAPLIYTSESQSAYQRMMRCESGSVENHVAKKPSAYALNIIRQIAPGKGLRSLPLRYLPDRFKKMRRISTGELRKDCTTLYHRLTWDRPSYTITCYFTNVSAGAFTHPIEHRAITPREAARLQSFPDWFVFKGASVPRQIGNAVPPLLAEAVGKAIIRKLKAHRKSAA
jgi:DNA (cytosine-5)-methyltransferase 1